MMSIPFLLEDDFKHLRFPSQIDLFSDSHVDRALTAVAREVAELLQQTSFENETIAIRAIELKYRHTIGNSRLNIRTALSKAVSQQEK